MKIVIPGGTGQIGNILARAFHQAGHEVVVLSRRKVDAPWRIISWDARTLGDWAREVDGADVVINLAGRNVNCRYSAANRKLIMDSRVESARVIGKAIAQSAKPPGVWLQASTATYYSHRYDGPNDDDTGVLGSSPEEPSTWHFSIEVAKAWESAASEIDLPATRRVLLRSAITFSPDPGGAFEILLRLVRFGLGGKNGDGRQFVSWIHDVDFVRAIQWIIDHRNINGPIIIASPDPVPNAQFMATLRKAWGISIGLPAPGWLLEVGTFFLRTETELVLKSRRVIPSRLLREGFEFEYPTWPQAAEDLCARWRRDRAK